MRGSLRCLIGCWLALCLAMSAAPAFAQDSGEQPRYRELIRKALEEYKLGNWSEAKVFFREAHNIWPNARTFRGMGMTCYESRNYVESISYLEQALNNREQPLTPKMAEEARAILEQARRFVSPLEVQPNEAVVIIDGKTAERNSGGTIVIDPGVHQIQARANGYEALFTTVTADGGNRLYLQLSPERQTGGAAPSSRSVSLAPPTGDDDPNKYVPPPPAAEPSGEKYSQQNAVVGAVLAPIGVAGIATGWVFYALRQGVRRQLPYVDERGNELPTSLSDVTRMRNYGVVSLAAAGGGALILSLSEYFWLPDEPSVPAWAWVLGGVGTLVVGAGIAFSVVGTHCEIGSTLSVCQAVTADSIFGPLIAMHGLPLLALPLNYAIRVWTRPSGVQVAFTVGGDIAHGSTLNLMGRF